MRARQDDGDGCFRIGLVIVVFLVVAAEIIVLVAFGQSYNIGLGLGVTSKDCAPRNDCESGMLLNIGNTYACDYRQRINGHECTNACYDSETDTECFNGKCIGEIDGCWGRCAATDFEVDPTDCPTFSTIDAAPVGSPPLIHHNACIMRSCRHAIITVQPSLGWTDASPQMMCDDFINTSTPLAAAGCYNVNYYVFDVTLNETIQEYAIGICSYSYVCAPLDGGTFTPFAASASFQGSAFSITTELDGTEMRLTSHSTSKTDDALLSHLGRIVMEHIETLSEYIEKQSTV